MLYKITFLHNSTYCELKPSDRVCQFDVEIEEDTKTQAIMEYHRQNDMKWSFANRNNVPIVWDIKQYE